MAKILYITRVPITAARFILPLARRLAERGNKIAFAFGPGEGADAIESSGFPCTLLNMSRKTLSLWNSKAIDQLCCLIMQGNYDIVHTYSPVAGIYGRIAAGRVKTPVVIHSVIGSLLSPGVPIGHRILYILSEWLTSHYVDLFITLNDIDAADMVRYRMAPADKIVSLRYEYGIDLEEFNPEKIDQEHLQQERAELGLTKDVLVIGFVGRMIDAKGIRELYEAYRRLRQNGASVKLIFLGDVLTTDRDQKSLIALKHHVHVDRLEQDVIFLGFKKDVPFYLSMMDIVVLPSYNEGFPRIPVEAGAMGKASITTATHGSDVAVVDGETGFIVPIKCAASLAFAINKFASDPGLASRMGESARQYVLEHFDQKKIIEQQIDIYRRFFEKSRKSCRVSV